MVAEFGIEERWCCDFPAKSFSDLTTSNLALSLEQRRLCYFTGICHRMAAHNAWSGFGHQMTTKCNSQMGSLMRMFIFAIAVITSMMVLGGCASSYVLSPDNLAAQLKAGQKGESA